MCYRPISIRIKPRNYNPAGGQLFTTQVSCCTCSSCQLQKQDEWSFRIFYEIENTLSKGGFVLSQALTYDDDHVPHLSNFVPLNSGVSDVMCFNRKHITNFLKLLRIRLFRSGYSVSNCLRYFISSQYGSDPTKTRRPHYHCVFSYIPSSPDSKLLSWNVLSSFIEDCWPYGRSDGFKTISKETDCNSYFFNPNKPHVLLPENLSDYIKFNKISDYVCRYVVKDVAYSDTIKQRCSSYLDSLEHTDSFTYKSLIRLLSSNVKEFHLQSNAYGLNIFKYNTIENIMKDGVLIKPSSNPNKGLFTSIPIPLYYARKFFMELRRRQDKSLYWCYTLRGKEFFKIRYHAKIENYYKKCLSYVDCDSDLKSCVSDLLGSRSLKDYALYVCVYKGRSKPLFPSDFSLPSVSEMLDSMCSVYDDLNLTYNIKYDKGQIFVDDVVSDIYFINKHLNNENSCFSQLDKPFEHFDDIFVLFSNFQNYINLLKDSDNSFSLFFPDHFKNNYK